MFDLQAAHRAQQQLYAAQDLAGLIRQHATSAVQRDPEATMRVLQDALAALKAVIAKPVRSPDAP